MRIKEIVSERRGLKLVTNKLLPCAKAQAREPCHSTRRKNLPKQRNSIIQIGYHSLVALSSYGNSIS